MGNRSRRSPGIAESAPEQPSVQRALAGVIELYRHAQLFDAEGFAAAAFEWLRRGIGFDHGIQVTSLHGASWVDAHFTGIDDPRAHMEGHARVRHLDVITPRMLMNPGRAYRNDEDAVEIAGPRFAPFREHLRRVDAKYTLSIAMPIGNSSLLSVLLLGRGAANRRFSDDELSLLEVVAPHVVEADSLNRALSLQRAYGRAEDAPPVALIASDGRFLHTTPAFARLFWPDAPPDTTYLPADVLRAIGQGRAVRLAGSAHSLVSQRDGTGGWLLRLRPSGPVDALSARELQVGRLFAQGRTYKAIAEKLGLAPATVRNHLQHVYSKLGVTSRDALLGQLGKP